MTTRVKAGSSRGTPSGYEGTNVANSFELPSCGVVDVDRAMFDMFSKELAFTVKSGATTKQVDVIFAAGEKWAMLKRGRALRDKTGTFILPLITIRRTGIDQGVADDITGRGINQQTGDLVIKRRLAPEDRAYQNLMNKSRVPNQDNIPGENSLVTSLLGQQVPNSPLDLTPATYKNLWEIITVPSPQFFTSTYEVTFWSQYMTQMNEMIEKLFVSYLPTGNGNLKLDTPQGYWFIASVESGAFSPEDNADDMSSEERIIKYKFTVKVPGYIVNSRTPGMPSATRRFIATSNIAFSFEPGASEDFASTFPPRISNVSNDPSAPFSLSDAIIPPTSTQPEQRITANPLNVGNGLVRVTTANPHRGEQTFRPITGTTLVVVDN